jgi:hypothetical protein
MYTMFWMEPVMPSYIWVLVLIGVVAFPLVTAAMFYRVAPRVAVVTAVVLEAWVVVSALLAAAGAYEQDPVVVQPWIAVAIVGVFAAVLIGARIPAVARALAGPDTITRLTAPHALRVLGVFFLLAMAIGRVPAVFALPAGLGDMAVGVAAPFVVRRLRAGSRRGVVWFNVLGIVDMAVAVSIGFLSGAGPAQLIHVTPPTDAIGQLPLALVPTVVVPLAVGLHVLSLLRLRGTRKPHVEQGRQTGLSADPVAR